MVSVASLLNPLPPSFGRIREVSESPGHKDMGAFSPSPLPARKQNTSKAAAAFVKAKPKGEINYPPYEKYDQETAVAYDKFEVQPIGQICDYPKRIPYNSEKKTFQRKTGRDGFEVYQYTFRMPHDDRGKDAHTVMWDYNVGLVRITSFFKSQGHTKTMPAKVMSANAGLRDISHSITGGSISAQGYWVPFEAAKAVAARFCYDIRHVLVPVFGPDFVSMCEKPGKGAFMQLSVDRGIIRHCTEKATAYQVQSRDLSVHIRPRTSNAYATLPNWPSKSLRPKPANVTDAESGYGTDSDRSEASPGSLNSFTSAGWTPVNSPRAKGSENFSFSPPPNVTSNPREDQIKDILTSRKKTYAKRRLFEESGPSDTDNSAGDPSWSTPVSLKRQKMSGELSPDIRAAYTLLQLNMADTMLGKGKDLRHRRASA